MTAIYFNSWLDEYKQPFGAIEKFKNARFSLSVKEEQVEQVSLIMRKEAGERGLERLPMTASEHDLYTCGYDFAQGAGLYFYYFEIVNKSATSEYETTYCGSNQGQGGPCVLSTDLEQVHPYQITCYDKADAAPDWYREGIVYQIFPDRFFNGNEHQEICNPKKNTFIYGTYEDEPIYLKDEQGDIIRWDFYGGNLPGMIKKIPYIKTLGVTVIYLNPIFEAASNHRYDTGDYLAIDGILGDEEQFKQLVSALHENGIRLILDGVFSHVGKNSRYFNFDGRYGKEAGAYQTQNSPYFPWFKFTEYPEDYKSWWGIKDLPEVDKANEDFQKFIYAGDSSVLDKWTGLGVDGWRLDVADELPDFFIEGFRKKLDQYPERVLIGEVWEDASKKQSYGERRQYIFGEKLHGVMNYPFRELILSVVRREQVPQATAEQLTVLQENYPMDIFYNNLNNIGTHDTERILTLLDNDLSRLNLAVGMMFMLPGVPTIYYGDEAGLTGGKDPENRKFFPWKDKNQTIFNLYQKWIDRRKKNPVLVQGAFYPFYTENILGILRCNEQQAALYLINLSEEETLVSAESCCFTRKLPFSDQLVYDMLAGVTISGQQDYFVEKEWRK
ncbi:glycoside hydrolase family 13 protein [Enterococcus sp. LJL51]|uniref:glycoside hydrolase family 13 protein n=1 Tax=Enterococcus sp. LJL51 TaxID=3416656 RepID=UPI003CF638A4